MLHYFWQTNNVASEDGGGMRNDVVIVSGTGIPSPKLYNCIIYSNTAPVGSNIYNTSLSGETPNPNYSFSLVEGSGGSTNWNSSFGINVGNNIDTNPLFVNPATGDYRLQTNSPCINAGDNSAIPSGITTDLSGNARIVGVKVDMGAYEYNGAINAVNTVTADKDFVIYPNPVKDVLNIYAKSDNTIKRVSISDSKGVVVYDKQGDTDYWQVVVSDYPAGIYFVKLQNDLTANTYKIVIE